MEFNLFDKIRKDTETTEQKIQKAKELKARMSEEEFKYCQEVIFVDMLTEIEERLKSTIRTSEQTESLLHNEKTVDEIVKRLEKRICEYSNKEDREFFKQFLPLIVQAFKLCIKDLK